MMSLIPSSLKPKQWTIIGTLFKAISTAISEAFFRT
jgi:hypothetical protein